jgi:aldose 1-epimerase
VNVTEHPFGITRKGEEVTLYRLEGGGLVLSCLNYGGAVVELLAPDRHGVMRNVVLGYDDLAKYEENPNWFGVLCGPTAGRISGASFSLDGKSFSLTANDGTACLHGGSCDFSRRLWQSESFREAHKVGLRLHTESPDGEGGYPGRVRLCVTYTLDGEGAFAIAYEGETDSPTLLDPTFHGYFNLSGNCVTSGLDQELRIDAATFLPLDAHHLPGPPLPVEGTPFDFRRSVSIRKNLECFHPQVLRGRGYDHAFVLCASDEEFPSAPQVRLYDPSSGRVLEMTTSEPCVVFYSGGWIAEGERLRGGAMSAPHAGVALEAQWYPNAVNSPFLPLRVLRPGTVFRSRTVYRFGVVRNFSPEA